MLSALLLWTSMKSLLSPVDLRCENLTSPLAVEGEHPRFSWKLKGEGRDLRQKGYRILVASSKDFLREGKADLWDSGEVSSAEQFGIPYAGSGLGSGKRVWWSVQIQDAGGAPSEWSKPAEFGAGLTGWKADWIGWDAPDGDKPEWHPEIGRVKNPLLLRPASLFRKEFHAARPISRATAYVTALGLVDLHVNGKRVADDLFTPGWTNYDKRVYYRAFDVTSMLHRGENVVGAVLGDGWYSGYVGYGGIRAHYGDRPRLRVQVNVEYADGSSEIIGSGPDWVATSGPTVEQDFLMGEKYDARKERNGWDKPGYKAQGWQPVHKVDGITAEVEPFCGDPVRAYERLKAKKVTEPEPGVYVVDFGQNLAGFAKLNLKDTKPGQLIKLRFAEWLNPDGTLYVKNLRGARATDVYICKGGAAEEWEPRFTFHGFRYCEVTGLAQRPEATTVQAVAISSATPEVGHIETSDPILNRLSANAWWTQKMNFIDIPTDCPQRDERLGWTGDAQAYIRTACSYSDVQAFFQKWLVALDDEQTAEGNFPMVAPTKVAGHDGGPAWADAGTICPWTIYQVYGDKQLLARHYPQMKKFVEFNLARSQAGPLPPKEFHCFGDWVSINADTPKEVIWQAYFAYSTDIVAKAARELGNAEDAKHYAALHEQIKEAFNKAFVSPEGVIQGDTQCCYVLALAFDLLDPKMAKIAADRLIKGIEDRKTHLSTGFVGTRDVMQVLSKIGRNDMAFRLLHNTTFPSWGFEVLNGATSIWERWDGWTPDKGLQDPDMNSFAHYAYGAVMGWVFAEIGGIHALEPGFGKVLIAPQIDPHLTWAKTRYDGIRGLIRCDWKVENGKLHVDVELPPNTSAEIRVPGANAKGDADAIGVPAGGYTSWALGSGRYSFTSDYKS